MCIRDRAEENRSNLNRTAYQGRHPHLQLERDGVQINLRSWAGELFDAMLPIAELMDTGGDGRYITALERQRACLDQPELTPSARLLSTLQERQMSFQSFILEQSINHHRHYLEWDLLGVRQDYFEALSRHSLRQQQLREYREMEQIEDDSQIAAYHLCTRSGPTRCASCCG